MSKKEKKFTGKSKKRTFFDRRVRIQGGSRVLSLGKIIPSGWEWVRLTKLNETAKSIVFRVELMELALVNAPVESDNTEGE